VITMNPQRSNRSQQRKLCRFPSISTHFSSRRSHKNFRFLSVRSLLLPASADLFTIYREFSCDLCIHAGGGFDDICSSIQLRTGAMPDQTDGLSGVEQGPTPQASTPITTSLPSGLVKTAGPPESALQTFPAVANLRVQMQLGLSGWPGKIASSTSRHSTFCKIGNVVVCGVDFGYLIAFHQQSQNAPVIRRAENVAANRWCFPNRKL
jgi:hypothetical protein